jgi:CRISPR/Cas system-associated exonuclease Cas4 (RecB family)
MEEAYLEWRDNQRKRFPWSWNPEIRDIEFQIDRRLRARGLYPPPRLFCPYTSSTTTQGLCPDTNHPHKLIASGRAEAAINTWGQHLFPLIDEAEVRLKGIQSMPNYQLGTSRSNYYGITGIIDVISSVNLQNAPSGNLILHYLHQNPELKKTLNNLTSPEYEIIIDYKGMRRPSVNTPSWQHHEWQILTYAWLRSQQPQAKPIAAGILFYLNELVLSGVDMKELKDDVTNSTTDIMPKGLYLKNILNWKQKSPKISLSKPFKEERSIRIIPVNPNSIQNALRQFDNVVSGIERCVLSEIGRNGITSSWQPTPNVRTCTVCDFKTFCPNPAPRPYNPTVP